MRPKTPHILVTFPTTTQAMAMEKKAAAAALPGRLIPVPSQISAGCGLGWCARPADRGAVLALLERENIAFDQLCEVLLR